MKYKIKYHYETGNSYATYMEEDILEVAYESIELAKEALKRIKEHYEWYKNENSYYKTKKVRRPKWWDCEYKYESERIGLINLPTDNGKDFQMAAPWCGYFERLIRAEIIMDDSGLSIVF